MLFSWHYDVGLSNNWGDKTKNNNFHLTKLVLRNPEYINIYQNVLKGLEKIINKFITTGLSHECLAMPYSKCFLLHTLKMCHKVSVLKGKKNTFYIRIKYYNYSYLVTPHLFLSYII